MVSVQINMYMYAHFESKHTLKDTQSALGAFIQIYADGESNGPSPSHLSAKA